MLNNTNMSYNSIMENIKTIKTLMSNNSATYNSLIKEIPKEAKGKTYNDLCNIANANGTKVNDVSTALYNLKMANANLSKVLSSLEKLLPLFK